ncbi:MAG TPA: SMP-30/gluconolactonase/LRE family protein [Candidatus Binataceae bacterium]|nr:SMP-30/gluconolactonase/LRE family protein [Candidatus Binataceae bacterium]
MAKLEFIAGGYDLVEALRVDEQGRLYFSEMFRDGGIFRRSPDGRIECIVKGRTAAGGMAFRERGGLVLNGRGMALWDERTGELRDLFTHFEGAPIFHLNDMTVTPDGSIITGSWGFELPDRHDAAEAVTTETPGELPTGSLFRVDPGGKVTKLDDGIIVSNGMGFSPDHRLFYVADSGAVAILMYDVGPGWTLKNRRQFASIAAGVPDGLAVDVEGGVWVACYGGGEVVRFRPDGTADSHIPVPAIKATTLVFGGSDLKDLYISTGDNTEDPSKGGSIYYMRSDIAGMPVTKARV